MKELERGKTYPMSAVIERSNRGVCEQARG
jgi:hypothetical protein